MNALIQSALHPAFQTFFIMLVVIVIERTWPIPKSYHPLTLFQLLAQRMALKVNPDSNRSKRQKMISGTLAIIILIVPLLLPLGLFIQLADIPQFFDGLLLLLALQFQDVISQCKRVVASLHRDKKALARHFLNDLCLRSTNNLSDVGLCKATIESMLLRFTYQYIGVLFWFLCAGGLAALCYRLIFELSQAWNIRTNKHRHFGQPTAAIRFVLAWLPSQITTVIFMLAQNIGAAMQARRYLPSKAKARDRLIATFAGALHCQLGGPVIYEKTKNRLPKSGPPRFPKSQDILISITAANKTLVVWIIFSFLVSACFYALDPTLQ
jgi:adenosylcobinamide-phosphate synthase